MKKYFVFLTLIINASVFWGQITVVNGTISSDTTWQDTILVTNNTTIDSGITISINPNTIIMFNGYYKISVQGRVLAIGTQTDSIIFTSADTTGFSNTSNLQGAWDKIEFSNTPSTNDSSIFKYCKFEYSKTLRDSTDLSGAICLNSFSKVNISQNKFINCLTNFDYRGASAIYCLFASPTICNNYITKNCLFEETINKHNSVISCDSGAYPIIEKNTIYKNNCGGINVSNYVEGKLIIRYNFIANNNGIGVYESSPYIEIYDNIITNNAKEGIFNGHTQGAGRYINNTICYNSTGIESFSTHLIIQNNIIWGNIQDGLNGIPSTVHHNIVQETYIWDTLTNIISNPQFTKPPNGAGINFDALNANFSLQDSSPAVNFGNTDTANLLIPNFDFYNNQRIFGGRVDLGAIENQVIIAKILTTKNSNIKIFPNPFNNIIFINGNQITSFELYSINGNLLRKGYFETNHSIDLSYLATGSYILKINTQNNTITKKIIKIN